MPFQNAVGRSHWSRHEFRGSGGTLQRISFRLCCHDNPPLRIDKGSCLVIYIIGRSGGTISSTSTIDTSYESSYFSPSLNVMYINFTKLKLIFQLLFFEQEYLGNPLRSMKQNVLCEIFGSRQRELCLEILN